MLSYLSNNGGEEDSLQTSHSIDLDESKATIGEQSISLKRGYLIKKRLAVVLIVLVIFVAGVLCRIFLPAPSSISISNSTFLETHTNGSHVYT